MCKIDCAWQCGHTGQLLELCNAAAAARISPSECTAPLTRRRFDNKCCCINCCQSALDHAQNNVVRLARQHGIGSDQEPSSIPPHVPADVLNEIELRRQHRDKCIRDHIALCLPYLAEYGGYTNERRIANAQEPVTPQVHNLNIYGRHRFSEAELARIDGAIAQFKFNFRTFAGVSRQQVPSQGLPDAQRQHLGSQATAQQRDWIDQPPTFSIAPTSTQGATAQGMMPPPPPRGRRTDSRSSSQIPYSWQPMYTAPRKGTARILMLLICPVSEYLRRR